MMSFFYKIGEDYYTSDWRYEDLKKFWELEMLDNIAEGINSGARLMKCAQAVVRITPEIVNFKVPSHRQMELPL